MEVKTYGSQQGDTVKTPTLRQFLANKGTYPAISPVTVVFKPDKSPSYSLVTEAGYRVNVYPNNPIHKFLSDEFERIENEGLSLGVRVDDAGKCQWSLTEVPGTQFEWQSYSWGIKQVGTKAAKRAAK